MLKRLQDFGHTNKKLEVSLSQNSKNSHLFPTPLNMIKGKKKKSDSMTLSNSKVRFGTIFLRIEELENKIIFPSLPLKTISI